MITCTTPKRVIPEHTIKLYRFEELSAEAKAHALDEWRNGTDFDLYSVSAEDEGTIDDVTEALEWLAKRVAIVWEIDALGNVLMRFGDRWGEIDIEQGLPDLPEPELWCEYDIYEPYMQALPQLKMDARIWEYAAAADLGSTQRKAYEHYKRTLQEVADKINRQLTTCISEDRDYHRSEEYFAEVATSCADLWFDVQGNQEDIPTDATVEEH